MSLPCFDHRVFAAPKDARRPQECQDAWAVSPEKGVAAVADGVSSSLFAGRWANLLVESIVEQSPPFEDPDQRSQWLGELRDRWAAPVDFDSLPFYQKPKFRDGAFSTLLWVEVRQEENGFLLRCRAVGDTCLFHVREREVKRHFPVAHSGDFTDLPASVRSVRQAVETITIEAFEDTAVAGDLLAICTDALAEWTLRTWEEGRLPPFYDWWEMSEAQWDAWLTSLREARTIRRDDTTLVLLKLREAANPNPRL